MSRTDRLRAAIGEDVTLPREELLAGVLRLLGEPVVQGRDGGLYREVRP